MDGQRIARELVDVARELMAVNATWLDLDEVDDKALEEAARRYYQLKGPSMGFSDATALRQTLREFRTVDMKELKEYMRLTKADRRLK